MKNPKSSKQIDHDQNVQERALVLCPDLGRQNDEMTLSIEDQAEEATGLTMALNLEVQECLVFKLSRILPSTFVGKGKVQEIAELVAELEPDVVIFNHTLSPVQQRNLERAWKAKVIDRTGLILEIFGDRAQTSEGKIQVELAALDYQKSRLVRSWTHLERQRGGAGFMGGPGETQIEIDRRLITDRITKLKKDLEQVQKNRTLQKESRERVPFPIVSLVGYTNAGKSTLFNTITDAGVMAEDLLFATLDPTMRKVELTNNTDIILSDTVGFIANLPTNLIAAFRATLEHVRNAHIILHVIDCSQENYKFQKDNVIKILEELGIEYDIDNRIIEIYNKIDQLNDTERNRIEKTSQRDGSLVAISALQNYGIDDLLASIENKLKHDKVIMRVEIPYSDGRAIAWIHEKSYVISEENEDETKSAFTVEMNLANLGRFQDQFPYDVSYEAS